MGEPAAGRFARRRLPPERQNRKPRLAVRRIPSIFTSTEPKEGSEKKYFPSTPRNILPLKL